MREKNDKNNHGGYNTSHQAKNTPYFRQYGIAHGMHSTFIKEQNKPKDSELSKDKNLKK